jgi:pimeloyl-ACP methyl ester carboxylesterase
MGPENADEFEAYLAGDPELESRIRGLHEVFGSVRGDQLVEMFGGLLSEPDRDAVEGPEAEFLAELMRKAASSGHYGYWDDEGAFLSPWGFEIDSISVPVAVWRAEFDLMVPPSHGEWLADNIPTAEGILLGGEGHISMMTNHLAEILDDLAERAGSL